MKICIQADSIIINRRDEHLETHCKNYNNCSGEGTMAFLKRIEENVI